MRQLISQAFRTVGFASALVVLFAVSAAAQNPGWGEVRTAVGRVEVRLKPDPRALLLRVLQPGTRVRVDFFKPGGWCALFDVNEPKREESRSLGYAQCARLAAKTAVPSPKAAAGGLRQVNSETAIRRGRDTTSAIVAVLAPGERFRAGFARKGFLAVFRRGDPGTRESSAIGYIPEARAHSAVGPASSAAQAANGPNRKPAAKKDDSTKGPVHITADRMIYNQDANTVVFLGNVHGTQGDMAIWSRKLTAYFTKKAQAAKPAPAEQKAGAGSGDFGKKIDHIIAEGDVRMVSGKNEGACGKLTYYVKEGFLRMEQNPILRQGKNIIRGEVIKHYIHENRSEVLSGTRRRVEAVFSSDKGAEK